MPWETQPIKPGLDQVIERAMGNVKASLQNAKQEKPACYRFEASPQNTKQETPAYYQFEVRGVQLMPFDIIEAFDMNFNMGCVVKYVLRAGRKDSTLSDLRKARNCLDREIQRLERLGT